MQGLAGKGQVSLAERFALTGVGVDQARDVSGECVPVGDQLGLADKLADAGTDHVDADNWPARPADQLHKATSLQDLGLTVPGQVVGERFHLAEACPCLILTQPYGGDLRVAIGDARHVHIHDRRRRLLESTSPVRNLFGNENAVREAPMRELQARYQVTDVLLAL